MITCDILRIFIMGNSIVSKKELVEETEADHLVNSLESYGYIRKGSIFQRKMEEGRRKRIWCEAQPDATPPLCGTVQQDFSQWMHRQ